MDDPLQPEPFRIVDNWAETHDVFTLSIAPLKKRKFTFTPGQYHMINAFGVGESPMSICSHPDNPGEILHTIRAVGSVTRKLKNLAKDDIIGIRGPFGNPWPMEQLKDKSVLLIAGGIGLAPLRPVVYSLLSQRKNYKTITLIYGARSPDDIIYENELKSWAKAFSVVLTVDHVNKAWNHSIGVVTQFIPFAVKDPDNTMALICGPEVMMRFCYHSLIDQGITRDNIYLSLERNMHCAIGHCGHCQWGPYFICQDGPVLNFKAIEPFFFKKEL